MDAIGSIDGSQEIVPVYGILSRNIGFERNMAGTTLLTKATQENTMTEIPPNFHCCVPSAFAVARPLRGLSDYRYG